MSALCAEYTCPACGGVLPVERRAHHERYWCGAASDAGSSDSEGGGDARPAVDAAARAAMLAPTFHHATTLALAHRPELRFTFEQQSVWGSCDTGGALWFSEVVLAEWLCAREAPAPTSVLELGCGAAPVAGLAAYAMGARVLFTDVDAVLPQARRNIELNAGAMRPGAATDARALDLLPLDWRSSLPARVVARAPFDAVLCSDCLFRRAYHDPLARTLAALVATGTPPPEVLVAFQLRDDADLDFFRRALPAVGLTGTEVDIAAHLDTLTWPTTLVDAAGLRRHLRLCAVTRAEEARP